MNVTNWGLIMCAPLLGVVSTVACSSGGGAAAPKPTTHDTTVMLDGADDSAQIPCEPRRVLQTVCQHCHTRPLANGAPFPLEHRSDFDAVYGGIVVREDAIEQLAARRMPLAPITIDDQDRDVLLAWLRAGTPAVPSQTCASLTEAGEGDGGIGGIGADVAAPDAGDLDAGDPLGVLDAADDADTGSP